MQRKKGKTLITIQIDRYFPYHYIFGNSGTTLRTNFYHPHPKVAERLCFYTCLSVQEGGASHNALQHYPQCLTRGYPPPKKEPGSTPLLDRTRGIPPTCPGGTPLNPGQDQGIPPARGSRRGQNASSVPTGEHSCS